MDNMNSKKPSLFYGQNVMPYTLRVSSNKFHWSNGKVREYISIVQEFYVGDSRDLPYEKCIEIEKNDLDKLIHSLTQMSLEK
jgi:hypothetical protein